MLQGKFSRTRRTRLRETLGTPTQHIAVTTCPPAGKTKVRKSAFSPSTPARISATPFPIMLQVSTRCEYSEPLHKHCCPLHSDSALWELMSHSFTTSGLPEFFNATTPQNHPLAPCLLLLLDAELSSALSAGNNLRRKSKWIIHSLLNVPLFSSAAMPLILLVLGCHCAKR